MRPLARLLPSISLFGAVLAVAACGLRDADRAADADTATASTGDSLTAAGRGDPATWRVTARGIGPVTAGMRFSAAAPLLGVAASAGVGSEACTHVRPAGGPAGVSVMVRGGEVARVQVDSGAVRTAEGAGIGDTEARIDSLYRGRVDVGPHKYTDGHYLTVGPSDAESPYRLVFETDGRRVTRYRAGRLPEVEWVEGCA